MSVARLMAVILGAMLWAAAGASTPAQPKHAALCTDGFAEGFPCSNVNLYAHITAAQLGGGNGNDIWGWTDPDTGKEYALMGLTIGTAFVDISDPEFPIRLGLLPTHSGNSTWRDIKTYGYYAFIVSEAVGHGMQVFDLRQLRSVASPPATFSADAHYGQFGRAHNIVIDTTSGFAFGVGSREGTQTCNAGLHMVDIRSPLTPTFAGCFADDGYTHDAQCVTYSGPDADYAGREICLASNEDTVTIVDVTNKSAPVQISRTPYVGSEYTHQGWLSEDSTYFLVNDELDETRNGHNTRTYIFDVSDLDNPTLHATYTAAIPASDHNLYTHNGFVYESNYRSGLRILDMAQIDSGILAEVAYFDTRPENDNAGTSGAWSVFPYFDSGTVIISDTANGLFIVQPVLCQGPDAPTSLSATPAGDNQISLAWSAGEAGATYEVYRALDGCGGFEELIAEGLKNPGLLDQNASGGVPYGYRIRQRRADGVCVSEYSSCEAAQTTGACTAPPVFAGIQSAESAGVSQCSIDLGWNSATPRCSGPSEYVIDRSPGATFDSQAATTIAQGLSSSLFTDTQVEYGAQYSYRVRASDVSNGNSDGNSVSLSARPVGPIGDGTFLSGAELGEELLDLTTRHVGWEVVDDVAFSGLRSYYSTYENSNCLDIYSPTLEITSGQSAELSFVSRYAIEAGWDAGLVQISNNGGPWQTITPVGGYPSVMNNQNSTDACGYPNGQPAFTGSNLTWTNYSFDLSGFSGQIQIRWQFSTDGAATDQGWWVDDVSISHVQVGGICSSAELFENGFE